MMLEAVWFKNGKEIYKVSPVLNIVCSDDMSDISSIEVNNWDGWHSCESADISADNFVIRVKRD